MLGKIMCRESVFLGIALAPHPKRQSLLTPPTLRIQRTLGAPSVGFASLYGLLTCRAGEVVIAKNLKARGLTENGACMFLPIGEVQLPLVVFCSASFRSAFGFRSFPQGCDGQDLDIGKAFFAFSRFFRSSRAFSQVRANSEVSCLNLAESPQNFTG